MTMEEPNGGERDFDAVRKWLGSKWAVKEDYRNTSTSPSAKFIRFA
jgi:hypothetical protein